MVISGYRQFPLPLPMFISLGCGSGNKPGLGAMETAYIPHNHTLTVYYDMISRYSPSLHDLLSFFKLNPLKQLHVYVPAWLVHVCSQSDVPSSHSFMSIKYGLDYCNFLYSDVSNTSRFLYHPILSAIYENLY